MAKLKWAITKLSVAATLRTTVIETQSKLTRQTSPTQKNLQRPSSTNDFGEDEAARGSETRDGPELAKTPLARMGQAKQLLCTLSQIKSPSVFHSFLAGWWEIGTLANDGLPESNDTHLDMILPAPSTTPTIAPRLNSVYGWPNISAAI